MNIAAVTVPKWDGPANRAPRACIPRAGYTLAMDWQAFWLTIRLAAVVTAILVVVGFPLAYWIAYSRWRWKFLVEAIVALPIVLPPTVLGFYVLVALDNAVRSAAGGRE